VKTDVDVPVAHVRQLSIDVTLAAIILPAFLPLD